MKNERWYILGAGAMGTLLTHRLLLAGIPCTLLHHGTGRLQRHINEDGRRRAIVAEPLAALADTPVDRLLLSTKAGQLAEALAGILPNLGVDPVLVIFANGMGFEPALQSLRPGQSLHRAITTAGAYRDSRGEVIVAHRGTTSVGAMASTTAGEMAKAAHGLIAHQAGSPRWFADSLGALDGWIWDEDIQRAVARKFAINCVINPLTAVQRCRNGELLLGLHAGDSLRALCAESEPALRDLGLWIGDESLEDAAIAVCLHTTGNRSSMLQDVLAGRPTELAYLNGELLRRAESLAYELPLNRALVATLSLLKGPA